MAKFSEAYYITAQNEGGYANHPNDTGGETINGISRNNFPEWRGWTKLDLIKWRVKGVTSLINSEVKKDAELNTLIQDFYRVNFWEVNSLDFIKYQSIANEVYDTAVNVGAGTAAKMLQEAINLCNKNGKSYPDIEVDGKIGAAGETMRTINNKISEFAVLNTFNMLQGEKYLRIMRNNKSQEVFWQSWLHRTVSTGKW